MEAIAEMPDNAFDLAIVDPPYGIGDFLMKTGGGVYKPGTRIKTMPINWNDNIPPKIYFSELKRISKHQIIWGANYYNCFSANGGAVVWHKNIGHKNYSQCEIASLSFQRKVDFFSYKKLTGFVSTEDYIHPCQKPVKLYEWLLKNYAKPGDKILDTHLGSGSIAIACHNLDFDLTGYEIDKDYYDAAVNRLEQHKRQLRLFDGG